MGWWSKQKGKAKRRVSRATGVPFSKSGRRRKFGKGSCLVGLSLILFFGCLLACSGAGSSVDTGEASFSDVVQGTIDDEAAARTRFKSRPVSVEGKIVVGKAVKREGATVYTLDSNGYPALTINVDKHTVGGTFATWEKESLGKLKEGDTIRFTGTYATSTKAEAGSVAVLLNGCTLAK